MSTVTPDEWVLLLFRLPSRPTAPRVRTWRRLQQLGAVSVKNSGYALPNTDATREDFEWLRADIRAAGGDAMVFVARTSDAASDAELKAASIGARRKDFVGLQREAKGLPRHVLADRLAQIDAIDYFGAGAASAGRASAAALLNTRSEKEMTTATLPTLKASQYRNRTWVTRKRPGIDRFASAWLIQRFIDPKARFTFASTPPPTRSRAVPFDMFGVEFGHQDGGCTFDTLIRRFGINAPQLSWLADLVRTVDLKLDVAASPDAAAVSRMVEGLRAMHDKDTVLLARGIEMIEALYRSAPASGRRSRR